MEMKGIFTNEILTSFLDVDCMEADAAQNPLKLDNLNTLKNAGNPRRYVCYLT